MINTVTLNPAVDVVKKPIGVMLPLHGVVVSGGDIFKAYSMLERIECDAYCVTVQDQI